VSWSLRRRLILIAAFVMVAALSVGGLAMYSAAEIEDRQMLDARLEQLGATILAFAESGEAPGARAGDQSNIVYVKTRPASALLYRYQVWTANGALVLRSHEAPDQPIVGLTHFGFETVRLEGEDYRTFSVPTRDGLFVVQVAECMSERVGQLAVMTAYYVAFLILPFGLIFGATWLLLRRSLGSVRSIATQLTNRNPLDATKLEVEDPPQEMLPVLRSLDALFERTGHAISVERRFTSVAAHEMRTPLAGLRAHAQLAVWASNAEESRDALDAVILGVDRASHLLNQLLDIARIEGMPKDSALLFKEVDIAAVCADALRDIRPLASKKGVSIVSDLRLASFQAQPTGLFLIVRNLVANAVLYCLDGGSVQISTLRQEGQPVLIVDDSGPGIAAENRERAFERFNRLGQRDVEGVGLGLSIVLMSVELHHAKVTLLDSPLGGLRCQIVFTKAPPFAQTFGAAGLVSA
jgi:signal transduction histidine kinase